MLSLRRRMLGLGLLGIALGAAALIQVQPGQVAVPAGKPLVMKLRRTCTACPNYTITLTGDGTLTYQGGDFAVVQGTRQFVLDQAAVSDLMLDFIQPDFLELDNSYPSPGTDRMTVSLTIEMGGLSKAVLSEDGYGPTLLLDLIHKMDDLPYMRALSGWPH